MRILVADDHEVMRKGVCAILSTGFSFAVCDEATNGQQAIEKALLHPPDIIILDVNMPVLGGFAAAKEFQQVLPEIPILLFTSNPSEQILSESKKAGVQGFVLKEQAADTLVAAVKALLRIKIALRFFAMFRFPSRRVSTSVWFQTTISRVSRLRRPPFPGRSTASAVFSVGSCVLSLVNLKSSALFALHSLLAYDP